MKNYLFLFVLILVGLGSCEKNEPIDPSDNNESVTKIVDVTNSSDTVSIPGKIEVVIPKGSFMGIATIKIKELKASSLPPALDFEMFESFEVSSSSGKNFAKDLQITLKFDPNFGRKGTINNGAAFYHEDLKKWIPFSDVVVDSSNSEIRILTNHLTKLGRYSYTKALNYTQWMSSLHFNYFWTETAVLSNLEYDSPYKSVNVGTEPWYIQDIVFYMESSYQAFKSKNLSLPNGKINVYIKDLGEDDGETSFLGNIFINQRIKNQKNGYATTVEVLPMTCAHELLHYVQDYYYVQLFSDYGSKWWLEATAVQADRLVWPNNKKFDAISYSDNLYLNLAKAWDNCNSDPEYYIAGSFLSYLINSRNGSKLSLPEIIVEAGNATDISYIRTILDNNLRIKHSSLGIGYEFANFIKWAIDGNGEIKLKPSFPSTKPLYTNFKSSIFLNKDHKETFSSTIPHLATAFYKALNKTNEKQTVIGKLDSKTDEIVTLAYKMNDKGNAIFLKELNSNDSVLVELLDDHEWLEIVGINVNKDYDGTMAVNFKIYNPSLKTFSYSWLQRKAVRDWYYDITFDLSGSVEELNNNKVEQILGNENSKIVNIKFANIDSFLINFTSSFSLSPLQITSTVDPKEIITYTGSPRLSWSTNNFNPAAGQSNGSGTYSNAKCFGSITIKGYMDYQATWLDDISGGYKTASGTSEWVLGYIEFDKY